MIKFNKIELNFEPRKKIVSKIPPEYWAVEMSEFESAFLCGALKKFQPKKILEVGVAEGGTTAIILQCLEDIGEKYIMRSIDVSEKLWSDKNKPTGLTAKYAKEKNLISPPTHTDLCGEHDFYFGKVLPSVIDNIGGDIDFVILDTVHSLPGEILDFLTVLPYLKKNAVIVMHDVSLNQRFDFLQAHATATLFSTVVADKFVNYLPDAVDMIYHYPNIAAFQINEHTRENIENVFLALILRWRYFPQRDHIRAYYDVYQKNYSPELCKLFEEALKMNYLNLKTADTIQKFKDGKISV